MVAQLPGLFTSTIITMAMPRNTSSDLSRFMGYLTALPAAHRSGRNFLFTSKVTVIIC